MIVGHSRPLLPTWSINGTGAAILSPTTQLDDGRPDTKTRFRWLSGAQSSVTSILRLRLDWGTPIVPRLIGIVGTSLPVGLYTTARFRRASDTLGTYPYAPTSLNDNQRIKEGPRGERSRWEVLAEGATPVLGCEIAFLNNVAGSTAIAASAEFTIGEVAVCAGTDIAPAVGVEIDTIDPTAAEFSWSRQPYAEPGSLYRQLQFELATDDETEWRTVYDPLLAKMDRGQTCAYVLRHLNQSGVFDENLLHYYAMLGISTRLPSRTHLARDVFRSGQVTVVEAPIPT